MKKIVREKTFCFSFNVTATLMYAVLFYYCLRFTGGNRADLGDEYIYFTAVSVFSSVFWTGIALLCLFLIGIHSEKLRDIRVRNILLGIVCALSFIISLYWVSFSKTAPQADQMLICNFANDFNKGDFHGLQKGGYVALYPQQLGMITLLRLLFSIFGADNYMAFNCLSASTVPLLVFSSCKIVRILSNSNVRAELYYLLFAFCCFPMYAYTTFVYGDLISTALGIFGVWMFLSCMKRFKWIKTVLFSAAMGAAVQLRVNLLILVIALGIVILIKLLYHRRRENFVLLAALFSGVLVMHLAVQWIYHDVRPDDAAAIPASLFISMGMNDDDGHAGWFNEYHYNTFDAYDYNLELAKEKGRTDLQIYFELCLHEPRRMLNFFVRKMNAQWNAPMYQSIIMNSNIVGNQSAFIKNIFDHGRVAEVIEKGMKLYQLLLYGSILSLLICSRKKIVEIEKYVLLIAVFGGFLFSLIWEAKTRYVLPYLFMQIPYMAIGIDRIITLLDNWINRCPDGEKAGNLC